MARSTMQESCLPLTLAASPSEFSFDFNASWSARRPPRYQPTPRRIALAINPNHPNPDFIVRIADLRYVLNDFTGSIV